MACPIALHGIRHIKKGNGHVIRLFVLSLLLATTTGSPSIAQPPPPPTGPVHDPAKMLAQKSADMALLLGLRTDQRPALDAMLRAATPPPPPEGPDRDRSQGKTRNSGQPQPFAEHLTRMEKDASQRADADRSRLDALRAFYTQLDSAQQQRFEALLRMSHGPMGVGGGPRPDGPQGPGPDHIPPRR